ncbi:MAG: hypothetical protein A3H27_18130 [Acidobacteria bacterium RIFCSPLOWO2_02_FULL_59_13]|nr:MAG: hypothetical protein A3H27_18130 [Acidobacteria bacterium RIFCSPLOWO2_02_FULL_59_13]
MTVSALDNDHVRGYRQFLNGFFVQDDWQVTPRLTVNLGVRYEFISNPSEVNGKISNFADPRDAELRISKTIFNQNPSTKNFMPRVGLAWDVFGNGKTALRTGFGTYYEQILPRIYRLLNLSPPFFRFALAVNPTFFPTIDFNQLTAFQPNQLTIRGIDPNLETPYAIQYNFEVQQQITETLRVAAGYAGTRGVKLFQRSNFNLRVEDILPDGRRFWPAGRPFINPNFGPIEWRTSQVSSFYNALELSVEKRLSHGLRFQVAYTFSRSVDDGAGSTTQEAQNEPLFTPIFWDLQHTNRGLSGFDMRHAFVFNYNYALPIQASRDLRSQILGGWELNGITTLQTGTPMTIALGFDRARNGLSGARIADRPNLRAGFSNSPVSGVTGGCLGVRGGQKLGGPDLYLDPCAFELQPEGFLGNLGRNTVIGPGLANVDFSIQKRFIMPGEGKQLLFRAEFYNIFNRPNFYIPGQIDRAVAESGGLNVFTDASGAAAPNFGRIFVTSTISRQIQFGLKYIF